jgi:TP901 family phage tail tape measure protein
MALNVKTKAVGLKESIDDIVNRVNRRGLNVKIRASDYTQPLGRITQKADEFTKSLEASNARVIAFGASAAIIGGVAKGFSELVIQAVKVEKILTDINVVLGTTTAKLDKFGKDLFNVARGTSQTLEVAAEAALEFSRQGLSMEETLRRTSDALILTRLTGIKAANAVSGLTAAVNGFSDAGLTTTEIINKLAAVDVKFAVSAEDLINALARAGAVAQDAGVNFDQLVGAVTAAQQITARGGAVIGNSFKTIFTRIQRSSTIDRLQELGITVKDVTGATLPALTVLTNLSKTYDGLTSSTKAAVAEQVGGVFQINILKAALKDLRKESSLYSQATKISSIATDEAQQKNAMLQKTLSSLAAQTALSLQELSANIGDLALSPGISKVLEAVDSFAQGLNNLLGDDAEGMGANFAKGIVKGIGGILTGPGLVLAFGIFAKLFANALKFAKSSLKDVLGIVTLKDKEKTIQEAIVIAMGQNKELALQLNKYAGDKKTSEEIILGVIRKQTEFLEKQQQIAIKLAPILARQGVTGTLTKPSSGSKNTSYQGLVPEEDKLKERMGAIQSGYQPGEIRKRRVKGIGDVIYNSAETIRKFPGMKQEAIMPPEQSKAGRRYESKFEDKHGFNPYSFDGYIPNFIDPRSRDQKIKDTLNDPANKGIKFNYSNTQPQIIKSKNIWDQEILRMFQKNPNQQYLGAPLIDYLSNKGYDRNQLQNLAKNPSKFKIMSDGFVPNFALEAIASGGILRLPKAKMAVQTSDGKYAKGGWHDVKTTLHGLKTQKGARELTPQFMALEALGIKSLVRPFYFTKLGDLDKSAASAARRKQTSLRKQGIKGGRLSKEPGDLYEERLRDNLSKKGYISTSGDPSANVDFVAPGRIPIEAKFNDAKANSIMAKSLKLTTDRYLENYLENEGMSPFAKSLSDTKQDLALKSAEKIWKGGGSSQVSGYNFSSGFIPNFIEETVQERIGGKKQKLIIKDGDSVEGVVSVAPPSIDHRLSGVDAIEKNQPLGDKATALAESRYKGLKGIQRLQSTRIPGGKAAYGRGLFNDRRLAQDLVRKGLGIPDIRYSGNEYDNQLKQAKSSRVGIWNSKHKAHQKRIFHERQQSFIKSIEETGTYQGREYSKEEIKKIKSQGITNAFSDKKWGYGTKSKSLMEGANYTSKNSFSGFIPNFADPLNDAIKREKDAGVPASSIRIDQDNSLISKSNPLGLAVTNKRDEPNGVSQGISRARSRGIDPKTHGASGGFIPNFNTPQVDFNKLQSINELNQSAGNAAKNVSKHGESSNRAAEAGGGLTTGMFALTTISYGLQSAFNDVEGETGKYLRTLTGLTTGISQGTLLYSSLNPVMSEWGKSLQQSGKAMGGFRGQLKSFGGTLARSLPGVLSIFTALIPIAQTLADEFGVTFTEAGRMNKLFKAQQERVDALSTALDAANEAHSLNAELIEMQNSQAATTFSSRMKELKLIEQQVKAQNLLESQATKLATIFGYSGEQLKEMLSGTEEGLKLLQEATIKEVDRQAGQDNAKRFIEGVGDDGILGIGKKERNQNVINMNAVSAAAGIAREGALENKDIQTSIAEVKDFADRLKSLVPKTVSVSQVKNVNEEPATPTSYGTASSNPYRKKTRGVRQEKETYEGFDKSFIESAFSNIFTGVLKANNAFDKITTKGPIDAYQQRNSTEPPINLDQIKNLTKEISGGDYSDYLKGIAEALGKKLEKEGEKVNMTEVQNYLEKIAEELVIADQKEKETNARRELTAALVQKSNRALEELIATQDHRNVVEKMTTKINEDLFRMTQNIRNAHTERGVMLGQINKSQAALLKINEDQISLNQKYQKIESDVRREAMVKLKKSMDDLVANKDTAINKDVQDEQSGFDVKKIEGKLESSLAGDFPKLSGAITNTLSSIQKAQDGILLDTDIYKTIIEELAKEADPILRAEKKLAILKSGLIVNNTRLFEDTKRSISETQDIYTRERDGNLQRLAAQQKLLDVIEYKAKLESGDADTVASALSAMKKTRSLIQSNYIEQLENNVRANAQTQLRLDIEHEANQTAHGMKALGESEYDTQIQALKTSRNRLDALDALYANTQTLSNLIREEVDQKLRKSGQAVITSSATLEEMSRVRGPEDTGSGKTGFQVLAEDETKILRDRTSTLAKQYEANTKAGYYHELAMQELSQSAIDLGIQMQKSKSKVDFYLGEGNSVRASEEKLKMAQNQKEFNIEKNQGNLFSDTIAVRIAEANVALERFGETLANTTFDTVQQGFQDLVKNMGDSTMTTGDAMKKFAGSIVQSISQELTKRAAQQITSGIFELFGLDSMGSGETKQSGGLIQGFASGGSVGNKKVPAMLTNGEYVVRKKIVDRLGSPAMDSMNKSGSLEELYNRENDEMFDIMSENAAPTPKIIQMESGGQALEKHLLNKEKEDKSTPPEDFQSLNNGIFSLENSINKLSQGGLNKPTYEDREAFNKNSNTYSSLDKGNLLAKQKNENFKPQKDFESLSNGIHNLENGIARLSEGGFWSNAWEKTKSFGASAWDAVGSSGEDSPWTKIGKGSGTIFGQSLAAREQAKKMRDKDKGPEAPTKPKKLNIEGTKLDIDPTSRQMSARFRQKDEYSQQYGQYLLDKYEHDIQKKNAKTRDNAAMLSGLVNSVATGIVAHEATKIMKGIGNLWEHREMVGEKLGMYEKGEGKQKVLDRWKNQGIESMADLAEKKPSVVDYMYQGNNRMLEVHGKKPLKRSEYMALFEGSKTTCSGGVCSAQGDSHMKSSSSQNKLPKNTTQDPNLNRLRRASRRSNSQNTKNTTAQKNQNTYINHNNMSNPLAGKTTRDPNLERLRKASQGLNNGGIVNNMSEQHENSYINHNNISNSLARKNATEISKSFFNEKSLNNMFGNANIQQSENEVNNVFTEKYNKDFDKHFSENLKQASQGFDRKNNGGEIKPRSVSSIDKIERLRKEQFFQESTNQKPNKYVNQPFQNSHESTEVKNFQNQDDNYYNSNTVFGGRPQSTVVNNYYGPGGAQSQTMGMSKGGKVFGPSGVDKVGPIMLDRGEYVIKAPSVRKIEKQNPGFFDRLNGMKDGGIVGQSKNSSSPKDSQSKNETQSNVTININVSSSGETTVSGNGDQSNQMTASKIKDAVVGVIAGEKRMGGSLSAY